ncbi:MAG: hypothetical protein KDC27_10145 [Acidobacteria bacterium]|nr:hypothetical protein [Acidobacteriota bacterium]
MPDIHGNGPSDIHGNDWGRNIHGDVSRDIAGRRMDGRMDSPRDDFDSGGYSDSGGATPWVRVRRREDSGMPGEGLLVILMLFAGGIAFLADTFPPPIAIGIMAALAGLASERSPKMRLVLAAVFGLWAFVDLIHFVLQPSLPGLLALAQPAVILGLGVLVLPPIIGKILAPIGTWFRNHLPGTYDAWVALNEHMATLRLQGQILLVVAFVGGVGFMFWSMAKNPKILVITGVPGLLCVGFFALFRKLIRALPMIIRLMIIAAVLCAYFLGAFVLAVLLGSR